jgi:hypothetical protein
MHDWQLEKRGSIKCGKLLETLQKYLCDCQAVSMRKQHAAERYRIVYWTLYCSYSTSWTQWGRPDDDRHFQRNFAKLRMTAKVITPHTRPPAHFHLMTPSTRPPPPPCNGPACGPPGGGGGLPAKEKWVGGRGRVEEVEDWLQYIKGPVRLNPSF